MEIGAARRLEIELSFMTLVNGYARDANAHPESDAIVPVRRERSVASGLRMCQAKSGTSTRLSKTGPFFWAACINGKSNANRC